MAGFVDVEGVDRLVDTLDAAADQLQHLEETEQRAGSLVAGVARKEAPRLTGALAETITATVTGGLVEVTAGGGNVDYAAAVHKRNPWMTRASQATEADVIRIFTEAAEDIAGTIKGA